MNSCADLIDSSLAFGLLSFVIIIYEWVPPHDIPSFCCCCSCFRRLFSINHHPQMMQTTGHDFLKLLDLGSNGRMLDEEEEEEGKEGE